MKSRQPTISKVPNPTSDRQMRSLIATRSVERTERVFLRSLRESIQLHDWFTTKIKHKKGVHFNG